MIYVYGIVYNFMFSEIFFSPGISLPSAAKSVSLPRMSSRVTTVMLPRSHSNLRAESAPTALTMYDPGAREKLQQLHSAPACIR